MAIDIGTRYHHVVYLDYVKNKDREGFEDFTKPLYTRPILLDINKHKKRILFTYAGEGTMLLTDNNKWYIELIHDFAKTHGIPLGNITLRGNNPKLKDVYNRWHEIHRPTEGKINLESGIFGADYFSKDWLLNKGTNEIIEGYNPPAPNKELRTKKFNCLNGNMVNARQMLCEYMWKHDLLDQKNNLISFHYYFNNLLPKELETLLPMQFDIVGDRTEVYSKLFSQHDRNDYNKVGNYSHIYDNTYFTVTSDGGECFTCCPQYNDPEKNSYMGEFFQELLITEKTFRPMMYWQPQIFWSSTHHLKYLKGLGFKTFGDYWDESYDDIHNGEERLNKICQVIKELSSKSQKELHDMYWDMMPILEHNKNRLMTLTRNETRFAWVPTSHG